MEKPQYEQRELLVEMRKPTFYQKKHRFENDDTEDKINRVWHMSPWIMGRLYSSDIEASNLNGTYHWVIKNSRYMSHETITQSLNPDTKFVSWVRSFLSKHFHPFEGPINFYMDNTSAIDSIKAKSKSIEQQLHYVQDQVNICFLHIKYISTDEMKDFFLQNPWELRPTIMLL